MDLRYETYVFRVDINMCNIIPMMINFMDNQLVKNMQYLKPLYISNNAQETNEESTSELGVCIVLGVFKGWVNGMDYIITCISAYEFNSKLDS